jgi:hypothetical protein
MYIDDIYIYCLGWKGSPSFERNRLRDSTVLNQVHGVELRKARGTEALDLGKEKYESYINGCSSVAYIHKYH